MSTERNAAYDEFLDLKPRDSTSRSSFNAGWDARERVGARLDPKLDDETVILRRLLGAAQSRIMELEAAAQQPTHYAFLIKRKVDREPWATIFNGKDNADGSFGRASVVVPVRLVECLHTTCVSDGKVTQCSACKAIVS